MKLRIIMACLLAGLSQAHLARAASGEAPITLVREGQSAFRILHAPGAPASVKAAAQELQHYIQKSARAKLPVLVQDGTPDAPFISLGDTAAARAAGLSVRDVPLEGFRIAARKGNIYILGPDTADGKHTPQGGASTGTENGVFTFLEDYFGVRWLLPGELGEDVPARSSVMIPAALDRTEAPAFQSRRLSYIQEDKETVQSWQRHQKLGFSMDLKHSHSWHTIVPPALFKEHPDWFAEIGGKRTPPVGDRYKLETTNPEVVAHFAQAAIKKFQADPNCFMFSVSPTDSANWSQSAASKALYDTDPHGRLSTTRMILKFYNEVARAVGQQQPGRMLGGYIYASFLFPPSDGIPSLEPNLFLMVAPSISYGYQLYRPGVQQTWESIFAAWSAKTANIGYYDLPNTISGGGFTPPAPEILNFIFPRAAKYGVKGLYLYGNSTWGQAAVKNYAMARLMWNPRQNAEALCREFYRRAYGEAAAPKIEQLYQLLDGAVKAFYNKDQTIAYTATPAFVKDVLAANYPRIETLFQQACAAATGATTEQRARLQLLGEHVCLAQWQLRSLGSLPAGAGDSPFYRTDAQLEALAKGDAPGFGFANVPHLEIAQSQKKFPPVRAEITPALAGAGPVKPFALRQVQRILFFPSSDAEIQVTPLSVRIFNDPARYGIYDALGKRIAAGALNAKETLRFTTSANQIYYLEVAPTTAIYQLEIQGAPYALATNLDRKGRGIHFHGKLTPLYFYVPAEVAEFTVLVSTSAPYETCVARLYGPGGKLVQTVDTQKTTVERLIARRGAAGEIQWDGFWRLDVEQAPTGVLDGVEIKLDGALPQWVTLNPAQPVKVTPLADSAKSARPENHVAK